MVAKTRPFTEDWLLIKVRSEESVIMPETQECEELLSDSQEMAEELLEISDDTPSSQDVSTHQTGSLHALCNIASSSLQAPPISNELEREHALHKGGLHAVQIAATGVKILDRPKSVFDLLTTPDLCP